MSRFYIFFALIFLFFHAMSVHAYIPSDIDKKNHSIKPVFAKNEIIFQQHYDFTPAPVLMAFLEGEVTSDAGVMGSSEDATTDLNTENEEDEDFFDLEEEFEEASSKEVFDPLSGYNRIMTSVNDKFYFWLLKPIANGYKKIVPLSARRSVTRFFNNLIFPVRFVNNVLQLKLKRAGIELSRFAINTTVGILGFGDPAKNWFNLAAYPEDFGQTLGHYGLGGGFHIVLPLLGPSNLRDVVGLVPDYFMDPVSYIKKGEEELAVKSYNELNETSLHIGEYESVKKDALDLYPFLREAYEQNRKKKIKE